jgi:hypothetical protein
VQQRAQDAAHMRIVVDHQEAQAVEIDADHVNSRRRGVMSWIGPSG